MIPQWLWLQTIPYSFLCIESEMLRATHFKSNILINVLEYFLKNVCIAQKRLYIYNLDQLHYSLYDFVYLHLLLSVGPIATAFILAVISV